MDGKLRKWLQLRAKKLSNRVRSDKSRPIRVHDRSGSDLFGFWNSSRGSKVFYSIFFTLILTISQLARCLSSVPPYVINSRLITCIQNTTILRQIDGWSPSLHSEHDLSYMDDSNGVMEVYDLVGISKLDFYF